MNYLLGAIFAVVGGSLLVWNKPLSEKFGIFYSRRFADTFGTLAHALGWDDPNKRFNKFMYRCFVFAFAAITETNFVGPSVEPGNSFLQVR
jgi:hypothetical protein